MKPRFDIPSKFGYFAEYRVDQVADMPTDPPMFEVGLRSL
jgi:hypothetical protein